MPGKTTVWLRRPEETPRATTDAGKDAVRALRRNRHQLAPVYGATAWYVLATIFGNAELIVPLTLGAAVAILVYGEKIKLNRVPERRYAALAATTAALWYGWSAWTGTGPPNGPEVGVLVLGTILVSAPYWNHRKIRGSIPVTFHDGMTLKERQKRRTEVAALLEDWTGLSSAAQLSNSKILAVEFLEVSINILIQFRRGAAVEDFTARKLAKLESAFASRRGASRVEPVDSNAQRAMIRLMILDPHAEPIPLPDTDDQVIGRFETGDPTEFELINTLVAGATGAGKSGVMNAIMCKLMRNPLVALIGIDLKPGGVELRPYERVMKKLAVTPAQAREVLAWYQREMERRGTLMGEMGIREWVPTLEDPFLVVVIDEAFELKRHKLESAAEDVTALARAFAGCVIVATQHPTDKALSSIIKANCPQRIGVKTEGDSADRVIFGENATKDGWRVSKIPGNRQGSFMIRNRKHLRPLLARAFWISDQTRDAEVRRWTALRATESPDTPLSGTTTPEVLDAVLVDDLGATNPILTAIREGATTANMIVEATGISRAVVFRRLKELKAEGLIRPGATRGTWVISEGGE